MIAIADSTVVFHLAYHELAMRRIIKEYGIKELYITRISYLELLAGSSENAKISARKALNRFPLLEFDKKAAETGSTLAMKYRVGAKNSKDFLIACIAIAHKIPLLTENNKDFNYAELKVLTYRIGQ